MYHIHSDKEVDAKMKKTFDWEWLVILGFIILIAYLILKSKGLA